MILQRPYYSRSSNASSIDTAVTAVVAGGGGGSVEAVRMELEEKAELLKAAYQGRIV